jgi:4-carboxymuconolactone decarboxylase
VDGTVEGSHLDFSARMTEPVRSNLTVEGTVDGDRFTGTVVVGGGGTFPLTGWRAV